MNRMQAFLSDLIGRAATASAIGKSFANNRDLYETLGYPEHIGFNDYLTYYQRGDLAARVIDLPAKATWRTTPEIRSEEVPEITDMVAELDRRVRLFTAMSRADRLTGIGEYGGILVGTRGESLAEPPKSPGEQGGTDIDPMRLIYLRAFHQGTGEITSRVDDQTSPSYGMPATYGLTVRGSNGQESTVKVPAERVIHIVEDPMDDPAIGTPRLQKVFNRLKDLEKVVGASAELYWLYVGGILQADLSPDVAATQEELAAFEEQVQEAAHGLRRFLQTRGVTLNRVKDEVPDPSGIIDPLIQIIAATAEVPSRIFMGSERGELASSQDQREWNARISSRQVNHAEPVILRPTIDMLMRLGVLPAVDYEVVWPPPSAPTEDEVAERASKIASAVAHMAPGGAADLIIPPWEFRELVGLPAVPPEIPEGFDPFGFDEEEEPTPTPTPDPPPQADPEADEEGDTDE